MKPLNVSGNKNKNEKEIYKHTQFYEMLLYNIFESVNDKLIKVTATEVMITILINLSRRTIGIFMDGKFDCSQVSAFRCL